MSLTEFLQDLESKCREALQINMTKHTPKLQEAKDLKGPVITYKIKARNPAKGFSHARHHGDYNKDGRAVRILRKNYDVVLEFAIWGNSSLEVAEISEAFEFFMDLLRNYYRVHGLGDVLFLGEEEQASEKVWREDLDVRYLRYHVKYDRMYYSSDPLVDRIHIITGISVEALVDTLK